MSVGRHAIVTTSGPMAVLRGGPSNGIFTDDTFFALPIVREFGAFPAGYAAIHFGADEQASRLNYLPRDPRDPEVVLAAMARTIRTSRYAVRVAGETVVRTGSKQLAERQLRQAVQAWRNGDLLASQRPYTSRRSHRYTATRLDRQHNPELVGALHIAWELRSRGVFVALARVEDDGLRAAHSDAAPAA